jgi:hypothetical protein
MPSPSQAAAGALPGGRRRRSAALADYVGLPAAEAIEAARGAGLRPAPERVESGEPGQHGLVVAQEPVAGSPAPRDRIVVLSIGCAAAEEGLRSSVLGLSAVSVETEVESDETLALEPRAGPELPPEVIPAAESQAPAEDNFFGPATGDPASPVTPVRAPRRVPKLRARWFAVTALGVVIFAVAIAVQGHHAELPTPPQLDRPTQHRRRHRKPHSTHTHVTQVRAARPHRREVRRAQRAAEPARPALARPAPTYRNAPPLDPERGEFF